MQRLISEQQMNFIIRNTFHYFKEVPSTSSSPLDSPPLVNTWYIPMSSVVASLMMSQCLVPSFLKRYFPSRLSSTPSFILSEMKRVRGRARQRESKTKMEIEHNVNKKKQNKEIFGRTTEDEIRKNGGCIKGSKEGQK